MKLSELFKNIDLPDNLQPDESGAESGAEDGNGAQPEESAQGTEEAAQDGAEPQYLTDRAVRGIIKEELAEFLTEFQAVNRQAAQSGAEPQKTYDEILRAHYEE